MSRRAEAPCGRPGRAARRAPAARSASRRRPRRRRTAPCPARRASRRRAGPRRARVPSRRAPFGRESARAGDPLDRHDLGGELVEHRGRVARARADVEHPLGPPEPEELAHGGDDVRLRDRLLLADGSAASSYARSASCARDERLARDALHRGEHALVRDPPPAELALHHPGAALLGRPRLSSRCPLERVARSRDPEVGKDRRRDVDDARRARCRRGARRRGSGRRSPPRRATRASRRRGGAGRRGRRTPSPRSPRRSPRRRSGTGPRRSARTTASGWSSTPGRPRARGRSPPTAIRSSAPSRRATTTPSSAKSATSTDGSPSSRSASARADGASAPRR